MGLLNGKGTRLTVKILVSFSLLAILLWMVDPRQVARSMAGTDKSLLALALGVAFANRVLMAVKWNMLARAIGVHIPWSTAVSVYFSSTFAGIFLPPTVGGDAVRTLLLSRKYSRTAEIISSIIVERVLGFLVLAFFALIAVAILVSFFAEQVSVASSMALAIAVTTLALCLVIALLTTQWFYRSVKRVIDRLSRRGSFWSRHAESLDKIRISCESFRERPAAIAVFSALTAIENILAIARAWLVAIAFGVHIDPLLFFVIMPIESFASRMPVSFDGFGLREGLFVFVLSSFGVSSATALGIGLVNHLLFMLAVLPGAWLLATKWGSLMFRAHKAPSV